MCTTWTYKSNFITNIIYNVLVVDGGKNFFDKIKDTTTITTLFFPLQQKIISRRPKQVSPIFFWQKHHSSSSIWHAERKRSSCTSSFKAEIKVTKANTHTTKEGQCRTLFKVFGAVHKWRHPLRRRGKGDLPKGDVIP